MGADIETRVWDGKDVADGYVFSTTFGVPGIQDTESGIYYPAYRDMTQEDFEEIEAYRTKQYKDLDNLLADIKKDAEE